MTDNIRQEAVERAAAWLLSNDADDVAVEEAAAGAIDASGLVREVERLRAVRDECERQFQAKVNEIIALDTQLAAERARTKLLDNARERWGDDAALSWHAETGQWSAHHRMYDQDVRVEALERQLAAKRELCDRLAEPLRDLLDGADWFEPSERTSRRVLADYDALRATERANTEKGDTDGVV